MPNGWVASTLGEVALPAATAKTVLSVIAQAGKTITLVYWKIDFDGITAGDEPVLVELCRSTQATAGTSTAVTPNRKRGDGNASFGGTAAKNYTAEPTVLTVIEDYAIDPNKGLFAIPYPLGREVDAHNTTALLLRCTAPQAVNCRALMEFEQT